MIPMTIVWVSEVETSVAFYEALGFRVQARSRSGNFVELESGDAIVAIHRAERVPAADAMMRVSLAMVATEPLEEVVAGLRQSGVHDIEPILDQSFGRSVVVYDPDGLLIRIHEHDTRLYT